MSEDSLRAALKHVRFVLFGNDAGPGPNAPVIGDTLWADAGLTLQDYIDDALDRDTTIEMTGLFHFEREPLTEQDRVNWAEEVADRSFHERRRNSPTPPIAPEGSPSTKDDAS